MGKIQGLPSFQKLPWQLRHDVLEHFAWVSLWTACEQPPPPLGKKIGKGLGGGGSVITVFTQISAAFGTKKVNNLRGPDAVLIRGIPYNYKTTAKQL